MPEMTGGAVKAIVTTVLAGAISVLPGVHAHAQSPQPPTSTSRAGAVIPDATAIEYGLIAVRPDSAAAAPNAGGNSNWP
ncbi:hypothetical protein ACFWXK_10560 [Streptomyces sp. NPDC059070]|uniref:hypothetical protein n=1 Tax=Streptomyces sp. NPDC059070 TaxID=3346713 RepID=UPI00369DF328